jgi:hypothetical protein
MASIGNRNHSIIGGKTLPSADDEPDHECQRRIASEPDSTLRTTDSQAATSGDQRADATGKRNPNDKLVLKLVDNQSLK